MNVTQRIITNKKCFIKPFLFFIVFYSSLNAQQVQWPEFNENEWNQSHYFKSDFLKNTEKVRATLCADDGCERITFPASDGTILSGLLRQPQNSPFCTIVCSGFFPGKKEGLSTLVKMFPLSSTLLFFDARGHGESAGKFFSNLSNYGRDELKDVIGAIIFMHQKNPQPLIVFGLCAGAYHATRALIDLESRNLLNEYKIKALIFDSGFASLSNACSIPDKHFKDKIIPGALMGIYKKDSREQIKKRALYTLTCYLFSKALSVLSYFVKPSIEQLDREHPLTREIRSLPCPILYIHSYDDNLSPIEPIQQMQEVTSDSENVWLDHSEHGCHHLKHKSTYYQRLSAFINRCL